MTQRHDGDEKRERVQSRRSWPVRRASLDDRGCAELLAATIPEERITMVDALAREA